MKNLKKIGIILFIVYFFISCQEDIDPVIESMDLETFVRNEDFNFNYRNSNVSRIKIIGNRLMYAHPHNPGYINANLEVNQLCCFTRNNQDFRQSLGEEYIVGVSLDMRTLNVYTVGFSRMGFLHFNRALPQIDNVISLHYMGVEGNFDLNGTKLLASLRVDGENGGRAFIFDIDKHVNFVGAVSEEPAIEVDFSPFDPSGMGFNILKADAFGDGWIAGIFANDNTGTGNYFISNTGEVQRISLPSEAKNYYFDHAFTSDGKLLFNARDRICISDSGSLDDLRLFINLGNNAKIKLIDDRLVVWNWNGTFFYEIENFLSSDVEEIQLRQLNNEGLEFTALNDLALFQGKVFAATSQGLFTKSLESFWDSVPEVDDVQDQAFREGIEFVMN